ncbi:MAG: adenylate/guanylate cyclase domain-containing protein [Archangium sp.]|nr:adenylate/guanylate cyclase domain-containing protein [Archangium sp.]
MKRAFIATLLTGLVVAGLSPFLRTESGLVGLEVLERWALDARFQLRGSRSPDSSIVLVVFDDATVEQSALFERRAGWAQTIDAIAAMNPRVIGVDAVFDVPERLLGAELQTRVAEWKAQHEPVDAKTEALLQQIASELDGDQTLAASIQRAGNVVLILSESTAASNVEHAQLGKARFGQSTPSDQLVPLKNITASQPEIVAAARGLGLAVVREDATRTVRAQRLARGDESAIYMPFVVPLVAAARGVNRGQLAYLGPTQEVRIGELVVPLTNDSVWIDFPGPARSFPTYPVIDLVEGRVPKDALEGKVVLLGVTRFGYDAVRTPYAIVPGVEVQASIADNVLSGRHLNRVEKSTELLLLVGIAVLISLLFVARLRPVLQISLGATALLAWLTVTYVVFVKQLLWLGAVTPSISIVLSLFVGLAVSYATESAQRRQLKKAFGHYVGEDVLDELVQHPEKLSLGGEKRELTVFFSDIRDFTTLSEKLSPVELVAFLNTYLSPMTRAVLRQGGLLDKYIGDAVMAVFGAPVPRADHAEQALRCVARMHEELAVLNAGALKKFGIEVAIGCGVNTGDMVVGNMGSEERFDYTVAGDAVNLSSRLEGLSKVYGVYCLVGDGTRKKAGEAFTFRELDLVQVKGKNEAIAVHELLSVEGAVLSKRAELEAWNAGLAAFRAGKLPEARAAFGKFVAANPGDLAVKRYLERLAELPEHAPADFSAVSAFKTK